MPRSALALALALGLLATACGGGDDQPTGGGDQEGGTVQVAGQQANDHGTENVAGMSQLEFELDDFYFEPTILEGEAGQTLTLNLFNEGDAPHTFTLEEQGIDEELQPGQEHVTVEVTFPDSGEVAFICRFHEAQGMIGGLRVAS
ncbi:MAG TPA: cupredoxin domain-containing protein [Actinomycetota bacterium]|nr:cupredoxin domain-containing protein [Actinomycetota bacterium]